MIPLFLLVEAFLWMEVGIVDLMKSDVVLLIWANGLGDDAAAGFEDGFMRNVYVNGNGKFFSS